MSLATDLEIHKQGTALLDLCADVQARIPRAFRASMGYRISDECVEILVLIGRANAARQPQDRATHLEQLLERLQVAQILLRTAHAKRLIATKLWATSIELTDTIGKMANGWLTFTRTTPTGYTAPVTSKKGVMGFGSLLQPCSESRRTTAVSAAFSLVPPFLAARWGSRMARWFPQGLPSLPTSSSCRHRLEAGAAVFANRSPWRPTWLSSLLSQRQFQPLSLIANDADATRAASYPSERGVSFAGVVRTRPALKLSVCESHHSTLLTRMFVRPSQQHTHKAIARARHETSWELEAWPARNPDLHALEINAAALHRPRRNQLPKLRRTRCDSLRALAPLIRGFSRRYGLMPKQEHDTGSTRQRERIRTRELPLGIKVAAKPESARASVFDVQRADLERNAVGARARHLRKHHSVPTTYWLERGARTNHPRWLARRSTPSNERGQIAITRQAPAQIITAWLPTNPGHCPAQGRPAAAREKPASPAFRSHAQGATLGSSRKTSAIRFSHTANRRLALCRGRVHLNPSKTILQPVDRGIDFVGQVIKPWRRTTRRRTLASALQRIEHMPSAEVFSAGNSYLGLVRQASHSHKERAAVCRALLKRGHAVEGMNLSKAFRRNEA